LNTAELNKVYSLSQLTKSVENLLRPQFSKRYWIKAEMLRLNHHARTGGCYPDLVEKQEDRVIAQVKSVLWKQNFQRINALFQQNLKESLKDGSALMLEVSIHYDPIKSLYLFIHDISLEFSIGQLEKQRTATALRLKKEGLFQKNKQVAYPTIPKRIAIISEQTSDGFLDFIQVLNQSRWKDAFFFHLFPAVLQGDGAMYSIPSQIRRIEAVKNHFDLIAIIRGGGSELDMNCYDSYAISSAIANCSLPVITGIGHSTNLTLSEQLAFHNGITPTAIAHTLIEEIDALWEPINEYDNVLSKRCIPIIKNAKELLQSLQKWMHLKGVASIGNHRHFLEEQIHEMENARRLKEREEREKLNHSIKALRSLNRKAQDELNQQIRTIDRLQNAFIRANNFEERRLNESRTKIKESAIKVTSKGQNIIAENTPLLSKYSIRFIQENEKKVQIDLRYLNVVDPKNTLKRGYSITRIHGKVLQSNSALLSGDRIETEWKEGTFTSRIESNETN